MKVCIAAAGILLVAFALASSAVVGQTVYKCTDKLGNPVFSTDPCGKDAKASHYDNAPAKPKAAADNQSQNGQVSEAPSPTKRARTAQDDISDSVADSQCRRDAKKLYREPSTAEIDSMSAEANRLEKRVWTVESNRAQPSLQAQYDVNSLAQQDQQHAATLRQTIAILSAQNESIRAESRRTVDAAFAACDKAKAEPEKQ